VWVVRVVPGCGFCSSARGIGIRLRLGADVSFLAAQFRALRVARASESLSLYFV